MDNLVASWLILAFRRAEEIRVNLSLERSVDGTYHATIDHENSPLYITITAHKLYLIAKLAVHALGALINELPKQEWDEEQPPKSSKL